MTLWLYLRNKVARLCVCYELVYLFNFDPSVCWFWYYGLSPNSWSFLSSSCSWTSVVGIKMTSFQKLNVAAGAFLLWHLKAISNSLPFWGFERFCSKFPCWKWARLQLHLSYWSHYLSFSKFPQQQIQGYSLWSVSHIFQPSGFWNPAWLLRPTSHPASGLHVVTAILGRPHLVENRNSAPCSSACDAPGSQSLEPWLSLT